jgi:hypothetical protein
MAVRQYSNNATATLAASISNSATSVSVNAGEGALFPTLTGVQTFTATFQAASNSNIREVVLVTARSTDTMTITRAQEGTSALAWAAGDFLNLLPTAADLGAAAQADDVQAQAGNYAADTGSANAYVANFTPALTAHKVGAPLRVKIAHTNTSGTVTFNDGAGAASAVLPGGAAPAVGALLAGGIAAFVWDGTEFQITELPTNITGIEQALTNLIYPIGAYVLWETDTTSPGAVFTWQTWVEVQGVVLVGRLPSDPNFESTGQTGGEDTHQLVAAEVPPLNYQDFYYPEKSSILAQRGATQYVGIGALNNNVGSNTTDNDNDACLYANKTTLSGEGLTGTEPATPHNNLQPYRVVRMWRRTA